MKLYPEVVVTVYKNGTGAGIQDLMAHRSQVAMISRPLSDSELTVGIWAIPVAKDGVAPIVNQKNPYLSRLLKMGLSTDEFKKIFTGSGKMTWGEFLDTVAHDRIVTFTRQDESGAADIWAGFLYTTSSELKGTKVVGDDAMIKAISENPLAIGFCNFSYAFDVKTGGRMKDISVVPFDLNFDNKVKSSEYPFDNIEKAHRSLWLGYYPKNLCRELIMGALGKPSDPLTREFLKYALTRGQDYVSGTGMCKLNDVYIRWSMDRLN
jgi:phosphate transport system substrate-binding protein